jgi:ABC-type transport system substrate-binding protein
MAATTGESRFRDSAVGRVLAWFGSTLKLMARNKVGFAGFLVVSTTVLVTFIGPIFLPSEQEVDVSEIYETPSLSHPLGTDSEGKDVLVQVIDGGRPILTIGFLAAAISTTIAVSLGSLGAFMGGRADTGFTWLADMVLTIPQLPLLAVLAGILRPPNYSGPALYFNYAKIKAVADPRVRRAIAHAIDMYENATVSLADSAKRSKYMTGVSDVIIKDWVSDQDLADMDPYEYDPDKATSMLEDLGFEKDGEVWVSPEGERMEYELGAPAEFADWSAAAKNLADQLTKFGIKTTVRTVTFTQWQPRLLNGQFEMGIEAWGQGKPHPVYSFEYPLLTNNVDASGGGMSYDLTQETKSFGKVDLEKLIIQTASGLNVEEQKATVTKLSKIFNELLPVIPLWERYGNNPALDGERVTGWLPDSNPIYQNSPYEDSFTIMMIMDGTLKPVGQ